MLRHRAIILTGAGRGIGAAASRLFGREGAKLVLNDLDAAEAEAIAAELKAAEPEEACEQEVDSNEKRP